MKRKHTRAGIIIGYLLVSFAALSPVAGAISTNLKLNVTPLGCTVDNVSATDQQTVLNLLPGDCSGGQQDIVQTTVDTGEQQNNDFQIRSTGRLPVSQPASESSRVPTGSDQIFSSLAETAGVHTETVRETTTAFVVGSLTTIVVLVVVTVILL